MSNWERKDAGTLADALGKHIRSNPNLTQEYELLSAIRLSVDAASTTVNTNAVDLSRYRSAVCAICRCASLYECDAERGWSANCAFVFENTSQFCDL